MYRKNKNNKNSIWYLNKPINFSIVAGGQHIKTDIFEITIYICSFTVIENVIYHFYKMLGGCIVFYFYFVLRTKIFIEKVRKPINKK